MAELDWSRPYGRVLGVIEVEAAFEQDGKLFDVSGKQVFFPGEAVEEPAPIVEEPVVEAPVAKAPRKAKGVATETESSDDLI